MHMENVTNENVDQETTDLENNQQEDKAFTQDDLNRVGTKEHSKGYNKAVKDLGFDDVESAKDALKAFQEWQESQRSESEKQTEILNAKDKELEEARANNKALNAKLAAMSLGVNAESIDDVIALSERLVTDETSMEDAIKTVLGKYPHFGQTKDKAPKITVAGNPSADNGQGSVSKEDFSKMSYQEKLNLKLKNKSLYDQLKGN
ncbi:TPA: hypothetical protein ACKQCU_001565 [Streptococcus pyogenes]|uniref:hypothetical protein n=1 Tax=Streptococcus pyogenes TaxID=1314 RepID=UPI0000F09386|nr:hypothetical protein [Streptococcus pyogenes]CAM29851.1 hypothetical phage protein [Streptococcus pyogenes str. Manfredo]HER4533089.1 hypothetical protein [Streptococcus pyogenes NGAS751]HER4650237.1 hypothetical protein [Streptococcus pyogenes NGAS465]HER4656882.1 hypothetical protein [Streptococcus pyogenes NGAS408]HER4660355.1 hypothetical protein [Streptococcus pyogenes NGAS440]HER4677126.1 hypothetical protein [Streptococcus pyogenes NGAS346]HER4710947.1 hypothetical protein [Strepto